MLFREEQFFKNIVDYRFDKTTIKENSIKWVITTSIDGDFDYVEFTSKDEALIHAKTEFRRIELMSNIRRFTITMKFEGDSSVSDFKIVRTMSKYELNTNIF